MERSNFVIVGCARSGTTSIARIFDEATNARVAIEPLPNLDRECRDAMDGRLGPDIDELIEPVCQRLRHGSANGTLYGEKNVTYAPFLRRLHERTGCRVVLVYRDGRDAVRSMIDWHNHRFGSIYRECADVGGESDLAVRTAAQLPAYLDTSDYARPRPRPGEPAAEGWFKRTRLEMCAYYWSRMNELYLDELSKLDGAAWTLIDYTRPTVADILRVARFLGLEGLAPERVQSMLSGRINSLADRGVRVPGGFPAWTSWTARQAESFDLMAAATMRRLGFYHAGIGTAGVAPPGFGRVWSDREPDPAWYQWMYRGRRDAHEAFERWLTMADGEARVGSVLELGCGLGVGYSDLFEGRRYVGVDISEKAVAWCRQHRAKAGHEYASGDFCDAARPPWGDEKFDLVMSQGTIDNVYDMDAALRAAVRASRRWVYITAYRGFFPALHEHRCHWEESQGVAYNDISPSRARRTMLEAGCTWAAAVPMWTGREGVPFETLLIGRVDGREGGGM